MGGVLKASLFVFASTSAFLPFQGGMEFPDIFPVLLLTVLCHEGEHCWSVPFYNLCVQATPYIYNIKREICF